jgi:phosphotransferase system  glucose/maltose/N-acetylglucosamine-specific IIC component
LHYAGKYEAKEMGRNSRALAMYLAILKENTKTMKKITTRLGCNF